MEEAQPSYVNKLSENRIRKIEYIQKSLLARSRELDQRSTEIGALNEVHLAGFQEKAKAKQASCERDTLEMMRQIASELEAAL